MGGLPKFLLPLGSVEDTLLRRHIAEMQKSVDQIVVVTRPENGPLLRPYLSNAVAVVLAETATMSETVRLASRWFPAEWYLLGMPDTLLYRARAYASLTKAISPSVSMALGVWRIRPEQRGQLGQVLIDESGYVREAADKVPDCPFEHFWGIMALSKLAVDRIDPSTPHVGYGISPLVDAGHAVAAVQLSGEYFDCGTPSEFRRMLSTVDLEEEVD